MAETEEAVVVEDMKVEIEEDHPEADQDLETKDVVTETAEGEDPTQTTAGGRECDLTAETQTDKVEIRAAVVVPEAAAQPTRKAVPSTIAPEAPLPEKT